MEMNKVVFVDGCRVANFDADCECRKKYKAPLGVTRTFQIGLAAGRRLFAA